MALDSDGHHILLVIYLFGGLLFHLLGQRFAPTVEELQNLIFKIKGGTNLFWYLRIFT